MLIINPVKYPITTYISGNNTNYPTFSAKKNKDEFNTHNTLKTITITGETQYDRRKIKYNGIDTATIYKKKLNKNASFWDIFRNPNQLDKSKIDKVPIKVGVGFCKEDEYRTTYFLFNIKTNKAIAYISIDDWQKANKRIKEEYYDLVRDYPQYGIIGNRITINFVENLFPDKYSGIGKVADQIAIEYCLKEGITPQILSIATNNSIVAHHKRGRKFFKIKNRPLIDLYKNDDLNKILDNLLKITPKNEEIDCNDFDMIKMYMPKNVIDYYKKLIKQQPILH